MSRRTTFRATVVYTSIEKALSASKHHKELYRGKLQDKLRICQPGSPTKVAIAGDQQTFNTMWNLKRYTPTGMYIWDHMLIGWDGMGHSRLSHSIPTQSHAIPMGLLIGIVGYGVTAQVIQVRRKKGVLKPHRTVHDNAGRE